MKLRAAGAHHVSLVGEFLSALHRWRTWFLMANQDIQLRYRRSLIGPFWISIALATTVVSIGLLYSEVMRVPYREFLSWFGSGLLAWVLLSAMISEGCSVVADNEGHLRGVPLPVPVLAARVVCRNAIIFAHNAIVVVPMLALIGFALQPIALLAVLSLAVYLPLGWFTAIAIGPVCARFRDLAQVVASAMQIIFFFTPIFWVPNLEFSRPVLVEANPFYHLIQLLREPLLGRAPTLLNWQVSTALVAIAAAAALASLSLTRRRVYLWL